jgi:phospholipid/cholesterol/gamma-HCH transport system substrate-binding protein
MSRPANHWKLGLFVVVASLLGLAITVFLGATAFQTETVVYKSYFDESVTGLEVGSPAKFRGVNIGRVSAIDVAPDQRHVEVTYELGVSVLGGLGLAADRGSETKIKLPADLRAQLGSTGITGVKYVLLSFFDVATHPPEPLPFPVPENHIPSTPSALQSLEDSVVRAVEQFPALTKEMMSVLSAMNALVSEVRAQELPAKTAATLAHLDQVLHSAQQKLDDLPVRELSSETRATIAHANLVLSQAQGALERVNGERGLLASAQRATDSLGDVAGNAHSIGPDIDDTLRDVREAAQAIRQFMDALERDSDMLLKGRAMVEP